MYVTQTHFYSKHDDLQQMVNNGYFWKRGTILVTLCISIVCICLVTLV